LDRQPEYLDGEPLLGGGHHHHVDFDNQHYETDYVDHDLIHNHDHGGYHHHHGPNDNDYLIHNHGAKYDYDQYPAWQRHEHYVIDDYAGSRYYGPADHSHDNDCSDDDCSITYTYPP